MVVEELSDHGGVAPVDVVLLDSAHELFTDLRAGQGPVDESRRFLKVKGRLALLPSRPLIIVVEGLRIEHRVLVAVLFLVLNDRAPSALVLVLVHLLLTGQTRVRAYILSERGLNNSVSRELSSRLDEHFSNQARLLDELEKGVVLKAHS